jgi:hypothetical protein
MKTLHLYSIILYCFLFFFPLFIHAQPPSFDNDTSDVPIDGGLSILLAMGIGYGIKKNLKQGDILKKKKPAQND